MVSVCVATYNGVRFIEEQLRSILACVEPTDEVIIADDGSTDGTLGVLEGFASRYSNVRVISGPRRGLIANFDHLLRQAKWFFFPTRMMYGTLIEFRRCWRLFRAHIVTLWSTTRNWLTPMGSPWVRHCTGSGIQSRSWLKIPTLVAAWPSEGICSPQRFQFLSTSRCMTGGSGLSLIQLRRHVLSTVSS